MTDTWEATFGDVDLSPTADHGDVVVSVHGLKRGKPVPVTAVADSMLQDGSDERMVRHENRDQQLLICLDGTDSQALAEFEATLHREANRGRNEFRWTPPDGFGATAVFDVLWADLSFADEGEVWDLDELRGRRNYVLTLRCLPFARSVDPFTVSGVTSAATPSTVVIDDATSTSGWFGQPDGGGARYTPSQAGSEVYVVAYSGYYAANPSLVYAPASPVNMTGTQLLEVKWRAADGAVPIAGGLSASVRVFADGVELSRVATTIESGHYLNTYTCPDVSVAEFVIEPPDFSGDGTFRVDRLRRTNQAPTAGGSARQKVTAIEVPGSARTPISLSVSHPSSALGDVLVYTSPDLRAGYTPNLAKWATSSGTSDSTRISGQYYAATTGSPAVFDVPSAYLPRGAFELVGYVRTTTDALSGMDWTATARTVFGAVPTGPTQTQTRYIAAPITTGTWTMVSLGSFLLPPTDVPDQSGSLVRVTVGATGGTPQVDEVWAFHMPDDRSCSLSMVPCGTGTPSAGGSSSRVWLDAPSLTRRFPAVYVGTAADRADARAVDGSTAAWTQHNFKGGPNNVFVVTSNASDALVDGTGFARWLTHPAE